MFYTPQPEEIAWARGIAGSDEHLLAGMVQLKAFNRLGYFPDMEKVPARVVEHIRRDLRLPAEVEPVSSKRLEDLAPGDHTR